MPIGQARVVQEGDDVTVIGWGSMMQEVMQAAELLRDERWRHAEVIDLRTLVPMDVPTVMPRWKRPVAPWWCTKRARTCGLGAEIVAQINEKALLSLEAPVERVTGFDTVFPLPQLEKYYLPTVRGILDAVNRVMTF